MARATRPPSAVAEAVRSFDDAADRAFDRLRGNPKLDRLFYGASALGDHGLLWLLLGALRGLRSERGLDGGPASVCLSGAGSPVRVTVDTGNSPALPTITWTPDPGTPGI